MSNTKNATVAFSGIVGATIYRGRKVVGVYLPPGDTAYWRTVRLHELIHALIQPPPPARVDTADMAWQAVQDALVHTCDWPRDLLMSANRDALALALIELRALRIAERKGMLSDPMAWNRAIVAALRALAIGETVLPLIGSWRMFSRFQRAASCLDGLSPQLRAALRKILHALRGHRELPRRMQRQRERALAKCVRSLMRLDG